MDNEYDILGGYLPSFVQHLEDTKARLGIGSRANEEQIGTDEEGNAAEPHGASTWIPAEQDAFFRAVSVHSRWRPDLIAACVPTKREWEVWMYLEALEEGVVALAAQESSDEDDNEDVDVDVEMEDAQEVETDDGSSSARSHSDSSDVDPDEVEDEDVDVGMEDGQVVETNGGSSSARSHSGSSDVDPDEVEDDDVDVGMEDAQEVETNGGSSSTRSRSGSSDVVPDEVEDEDGDEEGCEPALEVSQAWIDAEERMAAWIVKEEHPDPTRTGDKPAKRNRVRAVSKDGLPPAAVSPEREPSIPPREKREAVMARLDVPHLQVLDSILREGEATSDKSKSRECSVTAALTERGDSGAPRAGSGCVDASSRSDRITGPPGSSGVPESMGIDPLLALSGGDDPAPTGGDSSRSVVTQGASQPTSLEGSQPGTNMLAFPPDSTNPDANVNAEPELSILSPGERRRIQKRLYMRRKRALLRGDHLASEETGIEKLKPGKKAKAERSEAPVASTPVPCSEAPSNAEVELPEKVPKKNKPGLTLPYKLKAKFAEMGVDAAYLRGQGMDLLNLGALGRLMGLYSSLEHDEADGSGPASIDAQLVQHLQTATVSFLTELMHRAIVWREREIRLKERSRAWRHGDQFTIGAMEHAMAAMGARHKAYFKGIEATHGEACSAPGNAAEREASVDPDVGAGVTSELPTLSPHRDACTPLVCPPAEWGTSPLACLSRTYEREATRTRRGTSVEGDEDELMSDTTDEEAMEAELAEEAAQDERDMALSAREEGSLWRTVNYVI